MTKTFLIITIDVEEDDWGQYKRTGHSLTNLDALQTLHKRFENLGVKPTYLINYPVASSPDHNEFFSNIHKTGCGEVGAHLHPWNTPPFCKWETNTKYYSRLSNLPPDVQYEKIRSLTARIERNIGSRPRVFRGGRFSFDQNTLQALSRLGYRVDTTFTPFTNYDYLRRSDHVGVFSYDPYRLPIYNSEAGSKSSSSLWEIPVTIGFNRRPFRLCHTIYEFLGGAGIRHLRIRGILHFLRLVQKLYLSPELSSLEEMKKLSDVIIEQVGGRVLNMFFHSPTLKPGLSPFVCNESQARDFLNRVQAYLDWLHTRWNVKPVTLSECLESFHKNP